MRAILNKTPKATNKMRESQRKEQAVSSAPVTMTSNGQQTNLTNTGDVNSQGNLSGSSKLLSSAASASITKQAQSKLQSILYNQFGGKSANSPSFSAAGAKACKNVSSSGNTMLMSMLSDVPHAALPGKGCAKKRKRSSTGSLEMVSPSLKVFKQEHQDLGECEKASSSLSSQDNDHGVEFCGSFYSIKQQGLF